MKLSVVVPTVDRPDTFFHTLRTIVEQNDPNYEIVVIDNCGSEENKKIVDSFNRPDLFVYHRNNERLRMADNWEIGLKKTSGDYITFLGDDDGLVVNSLSLAREAIIKSNCKVLFWWPHMYWWPTALLDNKKSILYINRAEKKLSNVESDSLIKNFFGKGASIWNFERLPSIYNAFVSKEVVEKVTDNFGKYFNDENPDVFSGVVNSLYVKNICHIHWPLTVRGNSHHSNGVAFRSKSGRDIANEFLKLAKDEIYSPLLVESSCLSIGISSLKLRMINFFPTELGSYNIDLEFLIKEMINEMYEGQGREQQIKDDIIKLCDKYKISTVFLDSLPKAFSEPIRSWGWLSDNLLAVDTKILGADDIYRSTKVVEAILGR